VDVGEAGEAHRGRGDVRAEAGEHAGALQAVEAGLHGAAGDAELTGVFADPGPGLGDQEAEHRQVQLVEVTRHLASCTSCPATVAGQLSRSCQWLKFYDDC